MVEKILEEVQGAEAECEVLSVLHDKTNSDVQQRKEEARRKRRKKKRCGSSLVSSCFQGHVLYMSDGRLPSKIFHGILWSSDTIPHGAPQRCLKYHLKYVMKTMEDYINRCQLV